MIRRDYILRLIEEVMQALSRIAALKKGQLWREASVTLDNEFNRLVGRGPQALLGLSETELLATMMQGEPTQVIHAKMLILTALFKEAGDLAASQGDVASRAYYLKGLHLLLHNLATGDHDQWPDFIPKVEMFLAALEDSPLPFETNAMLMQHYERSGQFAKAEDALYELLDADPNNPRIIAFGISFYDRLSGLTGPALEAGNLPRTEVEAGLAELRNRGERSLK